MTTRLLSGPALSAGPERLDAHLARLGSLDAAHTDEVIPALEASGLLGRGGAGFPVGRKWHTVAERSSGDVTVLANGAEGEPLSAKDRALMTLRPHLVLDGADLAA
jgi:NADH:ubiquinone oxidoreductase subunit F (NADH-binding)